MLSVTVTLLDKPPYGSPCNSCGLCCIAVQCPVSVALFGEQEICPALVQERDSNRFGCGLMVDTAAFVPDLPTWGGEALTEAFTHLIGAGIGCDGTIEGEESDPVLRLRMRAIAESNLAEASEPARVLIAYFRGEGPAQGGVSRMGGDAEGGSGERSELASGGEAMRPTSSSTQPTKGKR